VRSTGAEVTGAVGQVRVGSVRMASRAVVKSFCQGQRAGARSVHRRQVRVTRSGIASKMGGGHARFEPDGRGGRS
jgi:hypothetical protein